MQVPRQGIFQILGRVSPLITEMSRSRRKTPKLGLSTSKSEKADKIRAHREERRTVKLQLPKTGDPDAIKTEHRRSGAWNFAKDGKRWVAAPPAKKMRK